MRQYKCLLRGKFYRAALPAVALVGLCVALEGCKSDKDDESSGLTQTPRLTPTTVRATPTPSMTNEELVAAQTTMLGHLKMLTEALARARQAAGDPEAVFSVRQLASREAPMDVPAWRGPYIKGMLTPPFEGYYRYDPQRMEWCFTPSPDWKAPSGYDIGRLWATDLQGQKGLALLRSMAAAGFGHPERIPKDWESLGPSLEEREMLAKLELVNAALEEAREDTKQRMGVYSIEELAGKKAPNGVIGWDGPYLDEVPSLPSGAEFVYDPVQRRYRVEGPEPTPSLAEQQARIRDQLRTINDALSQARTDVGDPEAAFSLTQLTGKEPPEDVPKEDWKGPYLDEVPKPPTGQFQYDDRRKAFRYVP